MSDGTLVSTAVWRPDVPAGMPVPVILDAGPYFGADTAVIEAGTHEDVFLVQNFVPHGYAYGRVSVRGSGASGGCTEFFGTNEQADIDAAVTYYGNLAWSSGKVALFGGSYDGATAWSGAARGNPHLATIITIAGAADIAGFLFRNGTADSRAAVFHAQGYWLGPGFGPEDAEDRIQRACPEVGRGAYAAAWTTLTGDREDALQEASDYWAVRDWQEPVQKHYQGSVFAVHGLRDAAVPPTTVLPFLRDLQGQGIEVKMLLGQWGHDTPDSAWRAASEDPVQAASSRWDFAEVLLHWLDRHLKGDTTRPTGPVVDIQDDQGAWRVESTWPPAYAAWRTLYIAGEGLHDTPGPVGSGLGANPGMVLPDERMPPWVFDLEPASEDLRFAGLVRVHLTVTPSGGGHLRAELLDVAPDGTTRQAAWGVMNLRYHAGGDQPQVITPGQPIVARMELLPADVVVPAGHTLRLAIWPDTSDAQHGSATPAPIELHWGGQQSVVQLPTIERDLGAGLYPGQV